MKEIIQLCEFYGIEDRQLTDKFKKMLRIVDLAKNTKLFEMGDEVRYLYIILDGVIRGYSITSDGRDITNHLACGYGRIFGASLAASNGVSAIYAETLTPCRVVLLPRKELLQDKSISFDMFKTYSNQMCGLQNAVMMHTHVIQSCSAKDRYAWFLREYPGLIDKIPHCHIASFLSITPVTLSRIRHAQNEKNTEATE